MTNFAILFCARAQYRRWKNTAYSLFCAVFIALTAVAESAFAAVDSLENAHKSERIRVAVVGDFMCHDTQIASALQADGKYDFTTWYEHVQPIISRADFAFGNLETTLAGKAARFTGYPAFNSPDEYVAAIQNAGFDALTTANNHSFDRGYSGIERTLRILDSLGIPRTGTTESRQERSRPLVATVKGVRIGIIAYTYGLNQGALPAGYKTVVNVIDTAAIRADIQYLQGLPPAERPDIILASLHWGAEYQLRPTSAQKAFAEWLYRAGAHALLGAHPHVVQTVEHKRFVRVSNGQMDTLVYPAVYSMGNFISGQRTKPRDAGVIVWLDIEKRAAAGEAGASQTKIIGVGYTPTYVDKRSVGGKSRYRVLDVPRALREAQENPNAYPTNIIKRLEEIQRDIATQFQTPDNAFRLVEE
jgi:poly-gamma-glutamate synthesis protein (capsule biosynthesis protein)